MVCRVLNTVKHKAKPISNGIRITDESGKGVQTKSNLSAINQLSLSNQLTMFLPVSNLLLETLENDNGSINYKG